MKCVWPLVSVLLFTVTLSAAEKSGPKTSPAERLAAIQKNHKEAEAAYEKSTAALPDTPEGKKMVQELWHAFDKKQADLFQAAVELARVDPKSDVALSALEWVLTIPRAYYHPAGKSALQLATKQHAANPKVGKIVAWVGYALPDERFDPAEHRAAMALIKAVAEKNPDRVARGQAVIAVAWQLKQRFAEAEHKKSPEVDTRAAEAEKAFEAVVKDYADCPRLTRDKTRKLGELARHELFELRHLRVGRVAPDIEGEDLDGVKLKLSDYRKKVVVLTFWGNW
jgi:hypothetical protein